MDLNTEIYAQETVIAIRDFRENLSWFKTLEPACLQEAVIVETGDGIIFSPVLRIMPRFLRKQILRDFPPILRKATEEDCRQAEELKKEALAAASLCQQKAASYGLAIHVLDADFTFDRRKIKIKYKAPSRIDFRQLVKDLAKSLHCRIEMYHLGARDEAKKLSGLGRCGKTLCCAAFLSSFPSFSEREEAYGDQRLIGFCGKTMCCCSYEDEKRCTSCLYFPSRLL